jgi:hypothetical protein
LFSTYFYIFILVYQLFFSDNSGSYNQKIKEANALILKKDYVKAYSIITVLNKTSLFENSNLSNCNISLSIKLDRDLKQILKFSKLTSFQKAIVLSRLEKNKSTLLFLKNEIKLNSNDSLIRLYEIFSAQKKGDFITSSLKKQNVLPNKNNDSDALILLDLMKKKEKYLIY